MADSTTALTSIVLLGLGLCQGPWNQVQAGDVPKPSIWADPGPIVTNGSSVTIWCQGSLQASAYLLYKEKDSETWETRIAQNSSNMASFLIGATTSSHAGLYWCAYYSTGNTLSERSDPLFLVVTGEWYLIVLIGVSVALVLLLLLFLFLRFRRQSKGRTSDTVAEDTQPERDRQLASQRALLKPTQRVLTPPSALAGSILPPGPGATQAKDPRVAAPNNTQEVTYAQLKPLTLSQESSAPPPSPSEESPEEPSMYATLAKH
ncbi:unnamed protein product [Pipistrellus nathusii]|uniref:Ig-like domain-containing protein n=1 Tax=Pipistrellus nathusii TaxID=59473 RepID=A0ABN9ZHA1_PIPNA